MTNRWPKGNRAGCADERKWRTSQDYEKVEVLLLGGMMLGFALLIYGVSGLIDLNIRGFFLIGMGGLYALVAAGLALWKWQGWRRRHRPSSSSRATPSLEDRVSTVLSKHEGRGYTSEPCVHITEAERKQLVSDLVALVEKERANG